MKSTVVDESLSSNTTNVLFQRIQLFFKMSWYIYSSLYISVMSRVLSMTPLHSLGHNDQHKVKHHFFSHVMSLLTTLLPSNDNCIINATILFILWRQLKQGAWLFWSCDGVSTSVSITWQWQHCQWLHFCLLHQDDWKKALQNIFSHMISVLALHDTDGVINSITAFYLSRWSNEMQHDFFCHLSLLALASTSCEGNGILSSPLYSLGQDDWNNMQHQFSSSNVINSGASILRFKQRSSIAPFHLLDQDDLKEM